jgi:hypothetical protein
MLISKIQVAFVFVSVFALAVVVVQFYVVAFPAPYCYKLLEGEIGALELVRKLAAFHRLLIASNCLFSLAGR